MKKLLFALVCTLFTINVFADGTRTCKVAGTTGSVVVTSMDTEDGAIVTFANDTDQNVNVTAEINYNNHGTRIITKMVRPHSETTVNLKGKGTSSVLKVEGTKCQ